MSTTTATPRQPRPQGSPEDGRYDEYIEEQLDKTRFQVKLVDLVSSLMLLLAAVLAVLLVLAIIDHWIVSLAAWARWLALAGLLGGVGWYAARIVVPLLFGRISSVYAARTIERSEPSLNNSLINFLMFRSDRAGLRASIYHALRHQAAADLSHVQVETAVDRSGVIKLGCFLVGVLALCAVYTILSPKSTFQSASRIIAPWANVEPPSRVRIEDVRPGNKEVYHNEPVTVAADCYDVRTGEPVTLFYSTLDGRVSQESIAMQPGEAGLTYRCPLSPDGEGIQQDLVYWIEAGDARSPSYRLTVLPAPTILVERIEYDYPAYTGKPKKVVERQGDIEGLEGTRITVHASANVPIRSAEIEFDPSDANSGDMAQAGEPTTVDSSSADPDKLDLEFDGQRAWGTFLLELDGTRTRPKRSFYLIRFSSEDGQRGHNPVLHRIEVTRDLSPEIEILTPTRDRIEVPEDGQQRIEMRGIDPDFGLSKITLRAVAGGRDVTTATLMDDPPGQSGQIVVGYEFKPSEHGLRAGAAVAYWAVAEDNRTSPTTGSPAPNTAKTRAYHLLVVPSKKQSGADSPTSEPDAVPDPSTPPSRPPDQPASPDAETSKDGSSESGQGDGQKGDQTGGQGGGEGNQGSDDSSGEESGDTAQDGSGSQGSAGTSGAGAKDGAQKTGEGGTSGAGGSTDQSGEGSSSGSTGATQSGQSGSGGLGEHGAGDNSGSPQDTSPSGTGAEPTGEGAFREEPLHDGEAFERALEHMRKQQGGDSSDTSGSGQSTGETKPADAPSGSQSPDGQADGGHQEQPQQGAADGSADGGQQQTGSPKAQGGQESEASGGAQQPNGTGAPKSGQQQSEGNQDAGQRKEGSSGSGGKPKGGAESNQGKKPSGGGAGKPKDSGQGDSGKSGAGQKSQDKSGSAGSQQENRDQQKKQGGQSGKPKSGSGSQSPSHSKRQSDSSGSQGGDRSGGGKKGGGQGANQQGNDSSGSNSPGDDGNSASDESGAGDEANRPGGRAPSQGETGTPGVQKGEGSATDPSPGGKGEGGTADGSDDPESTERALGSPATGATDKRGQGIPMGGGKPSDAELRGFDLTGEVPPGEQPNLEYARKAANLALEHLKDQQHNPDQELLDKLGWTEEQMQNFITRWESMKRAAAEDEVGKRELDEALRSLGLRSGRGTTRRVNSVDDASRGLRDAGGQSGPPPSIREQFNAYKKGTARIGGN